MQDIREKVWQEIIPPEGKTAVQRGGLFIHSLEHYGGYELVMPDVRNLSTKNGAVFALALVSMLKRESQRASEILFPHFDTDLGFPVAKLCPSQEDLEQFIGQLFSVIAEYPRYAVTLNIGDDIEFEARRLTRAVLDMLSRGQTAVEPQIVFRIRRGANYEPGDPNHDLLLLALEVARTRKGIAFSIMDSPINSEWTNRVSYTAWGLRVEPADCDLYLGCRGHVVPGRVSLNLPLLLSLGYQHLVSALETAAKLLAHRLEIAQHPSPLALPLIINLWGLSMDANTDELLRLIADKVSLLRREYGCNFLLSATADDVSFASLLPAPQGVCSPVFAATAQHLLTGGHYYTMPAGPHRSLAEMYESLTLSARAGISFVRFALDDVRCADCALPVAAQGPCPQCGQLARRVVVNIGTHLEGRLKDYAAEVLAFSRAPA